MTDPEMRLSVGKRETYMITELIEKARPGSEVFHPNTFQDRTLFSATGKRHPALESGFRISTTHSTRCDVRHGATVQLVAVAFGPDWHIQMLSFILMGWGFYMLHGCLQVFATTIGPSSIFLTPTVPSSATANTILLA